MGGQMGPFFSEKSLEERIEEIQDNSIYPYKISKIDEIKELKNYGKYADIDLERKVRRSRRRLLKIFNERFNI